MESGLTKNRIFAELAKSPHGKLEEYLPIGRQAAQEEQEFFAHLISWNRDRGQIRDSKVALPVVSLSVPNFSDPELVENSMAHLAILRPREFARAVSFSKQIKVPGHGHGIRRLVERVLRRIEDTNIDRVSLLHRESLKRLYSFPYTGGKLKPSNYANVLLNGRNLDKSPAAYPPGSLRYIVGKLKDMPALEAAGTIHARKIPFLVAAGALGSRFKEPEILMALITAMSPAELNNNMTLLERAGVKKDPILRAALEVALVKSAQSSAAPALKMTKAIESVEDEELKEKLAAVQEKKLDSMGIEGNWLVIADKSSSMGPAIEASRQLAAVLSRLVKGKVHLVFVDEGPRYIDATGKTLEQIVAATRLVAAQGWTCLGAGLQYAVENSLEVDGVAIVTDGGENRHPLYHAAHAAYKEKFGKNLPTYMYRVGGGDQDAMSLNCERFGVAVQRFDISATDYYSIPNIVQSMRTNRYSLIDEIMAVPLLTIDKVLGEVRSAARV